jgi:hypothetical protein
VISKQKILEFRFWIYLLDPESFEILAKSWKI